MNVLLNSCKQNITSLSLFVGTTVDFLILRNSKNILNWPGVYSRGKFVSFDSLRPINNLSVKQGRVFPGLTST